MKRKDKFSPLGWVLKIFKKFTLKTTLMCLSSIAVSLGYIALAFVSKSILETKDKNSIINGAIILAVIIILQVILSGVSAMLKTSVQGKFTIALRQYLFRIINSKKYSETQKYHSGDILNRFTSDTEVIVSNTVSILPDICSMLSKIIGGAAALIILEPTIAVIVIIFGALIPAIGRLINKRYKYLHKECHRTEGETRSFLQECFENSVVIKTFKSEAPFNEKLSQYMQTNYRFKIRRTLVSVFSHLSLYSFFTIGYYAVLVWGAGAIADKAISYGTLIAFLQLVSQLRAPLQNISSIFPRYYAICASAERLAELENLANEPVCENNPLPDFSYLSGKDITFAYNNKNVLEHFNFKIHNGTITAITGSSGKGKSTLFKLILGLYEPQNGKLTVNGQTIVNAATRSLFAFVPQGNMILSGTIKENLTICNPNTTEEQLINACKTAEIHDYIVSLPNGYDTPLNERGGGLSEGQIQRLSLARALLADSPVLLLDESTSALDSDTELKVLQNIKGLKNKTVILVTHRKTAIDFCDNIISI